MEVQEKSRPLQESRVEMNETAGSQENGKTQGSGTPFHFQTSERRSDFRRRSAGTSPIAGFQRDCNSDRSSVRNKGVCRYVNVHFKGVDIWDDFLPMHLGIEDVILGLQWLSTLIMTYTDGKRQVMKFEVGKQNVTTKGDPSLGRSLISLTKMIKTLQTEKHGFMVEVNEIQQGQVVNEAETQACLQAVLSEIEEIFSKPKGLPPIRSHENDILFVFSLTGKAYQNLKQRWLQGFQHSTLRTRWKISGGELIGL